MDLLQDTMISLSSLHSKWTSQQTKLIEEKQYIASTLLVKQIEQEQLQMNLKEGEDELQELSSRYNQLQNNLHQQETLLSSLSYSQTHEKAWENDEKQYEHLLEQQQEKNSQVEGLRKELKEVIRKEAKQQFSERDYQYLLNNIE